MARDRLAVKMVIVTGTVGFLALTPQLSFADTVNRPSSIVIAHRGAADYRTENTLPSYALAVEQGADYVETDVVPTKDGALVARGDNEISGTTDVSAHPEFAGRKTTKTVDGAAVTGWFTEDFTLAELKTLRAKERLPQLRPGNTVYDGQFDVPTLDETIAQVRASSRQLHRQVGLYIEVKHPTYFRSIGLPVEERLACTLLRQDLAGPSAKVFLQSFEPSSLKILKTLTRLPLVQGLDVSGKPYDFTVAGDPRTYADLITPAGLAWIARYADAVGANASLIVPRDTANHSLPPTDLVRTAHGAGLQVQAWTFRLENAFLPADFQTGTDPAAHGNLTGWLQSFYGVGVDGVFTEAPDVAVAARPRTS